MRICRICLDISDQLISLNTDSIDSLPIVHMLKEFTFTNAETKLPKYICETCANSLDNAYTFKRRYEDSMIKFLRQRQNDMPDVDDTNKDRRNVSQDTTQLRLSEATSLTTCEVNVQEIDIEEMDVKLLTTEIVAQPETNGHENRLNSSLQTVFLPSLQIGEAVGVEFPTGEKASISQSENLSEASHHDAGRSYFATSAMLPEVVESMDSKNILLLPSFVSAEHPNNGIKKENLQEMKLTKCFVKLSRAQIQDENYPDDNKMPTFRVLRSQLSQVERKCFKCDICSRWFKTKGQRKTHRMRHFANGKRIRCQKCMLTFLVKPHFQSHRCAQIYV